MPQGDLLHFDVRGKLRRLRSALHGRLLGEGLAWLLISLVALVFVTLGFDYLLRADRPLRAVVMVVAVGGVAFVVWRQLIVPMRVPMDAAALTLLVERRWGQLGDRLISALQFTDRPDVIEAGMSEAMILRVADEANALAKPLNFKELVERRSLRRLAAIAVCTAALLAGFTVWQTDVMKLWFQRNVAFAEVDWPQETYLEVLGEPFHVLRGSDLRVEIVVKEGVAPPYVTLHARYPSIGSTEERVEPAGNGQHSYVKLFPAVSEEFEFYVTGGDDYRDKRNKHSVHLIDPPKLEKVNFKVRYPNYTGRAPEFVDGGRAIIAVLVGGKVEVYGKANKDLRSAAILLDGNVVATILIDPNAPRNLVGEFGVGRENRSVSQTLQFALKDTDGYANPLSQQQYVIQVKPDTAPGVEVRKRAVGTVLTPRAFIPLWVHANDDYGVEVVRVQAAYGGKAQQMGDPVKPPADKRLDFGYNPHPDVDIEPLKLQPGDVVRISAAAEDALPKEFGGPNTGFSPTLDFRIVKSEELMGDLVRRQKELTIEFMQAIALQDQARAKTEGAGESLAASQSAEALRRVDDSIKLQTTVGSECAKAVDTLTAIREEMWCNRLVEASEYNAMNDKIIKPIQDLAEPMGKVTEELGKASAAMKASAAVDAAKLREQAAEQERIRAVMEEILQRMQKLEGQLELANQLKVIIDWSDELQRQIKAVADQKTGGLFDPTTQPGRSGPK
jgi:hypothetical protein